MDYKRFDQLCKRLTECYQKLDKEACYKIAPCSDDASIRAVEERLGVILPKQLRDFFLNFSGEFEICAFLPDDFCEYLPDELRELFAVGCVISVEEVESNEMARRDWVSECFSDVEDKYDKVWHGKLGIIDVGNGDIISLDITADPLNPPVVYLSHDDGDGHGFVIGKDFDTFLMNLIMVGGCGMEDWQILPFISGSQEGIDPYCENAKLYRNLIGFDCESQKTD